jgi:hypothetical protein
MMTDIQCEEFVERLADLLERDVDEATRASLESHALACVDCGGLLADMRKLRIDALSLPVLAPGRDLWEGISERIDAPVIPLRAGGREHAKGVRPGRRWAPMAAAAVLLVAVTATSTYFLTIQSRGADSRVASTAARVGADSVLPAPVVAQPTSTVAATDVVTGKAARSAAPAQRTPGSSTASAARLVSTKPSAVQVYTSEIARLRVIVDRRRTQLDPVTVSIIERNLTVIDEAIAQCKVALRKDPASRFLMESLNNALENKVQLLRTATMLPARS